MLFSIHFNTILVAAIAFAVGSSALHVDFTKRDTQSSIGDILSQSNHYGSPIPPWEAESLPGWYYGDNQSLVQTLLPGLPWLKDSLICLIIDLLPFCLHCPQPPPRPPVGTPPPSDGYTLVFSNLTGAIEGSDFLTFGLVDTVDDCKDMCNTVSGCVFINTYHDVNGKGGSDLLTCALFSGCHTAADAINMGGQTQPDGSVDFIIDSAGFCKES